MLQSTDLLNDPAERAGHSKMFVKEKKGSFSPNENNQTTHSIRLNILLQPPLTHIAHYSPDE